MNSLIWKTGVLFTCLALWGSAVSALSFSSAPLPRDIPAIFNEMKISQFVKLKILDIREAGAARITLKERASIAWMKRGMKRTLKRKGDQTVGQYLENNKGKNSGLLFAILIAVFIVFVVLISGPFFSM